MKEYKRNYWPHAIILSIIAIIFASAYTVVIALDNPVEMDDFYLQKYQDVDKNINTIIKKQKAFFDRYEIKGDVKVLDLAKANTITYTIFDKKEQKEVSDAKLLLHLTRPDTNKFNQNINATFKDGKYIFEAVKVAKEGRWQLKLKAQIGSLEGFSEFEANAMDMKKQKAFFERYEYVCENAHLKYAQKNSIVFSLKDKKSQKLVSGATIYLRILHPDGKKFTKNIKASFENGKYIFKTKKLHHTGEWSLDSRILYDGYEIFVNQKLNAIR